MDGITKAYAMTNAHISFVSLVDKAANKKTFLITKAEEGKATFQTYGRILKTDQTAHHVTGIVYEPMVEDTQGNYMTEEEITKAAHWFMKNQGSVDLQHSFEALEGATVVESYIAKCDEEIEGETIKKGTWVMTVEITDPAVFEAIEKGELTGFSMGGVGEYSQEDVDISETGDPVDADAVEKRGILRKVAKFFGIDLVEKGEVKDRFNRTYVSNNFSNAWWALNSCLTDVWDAEAGVWGPEKDLSKVQEALRDFVDISTEIFRHADEDSIFKCAEGEDMPPIVKAGKVISRKNMETLKSIHESLGSFLSSFEETEETEDTEVSKEEINEIVKAAVTEVMATVAAPVQKAEEPAPQEEEKITKADIQNMIDEAIRKAVTEGVEVPEEEPEEETTESAVEKAVRKALEPFMKQEGLSTNLNDMGGIQKSDEEHYLHGII